MRQIVSTAVVAVIVGALAGATMSAVAQAPAEQAITPAAGINAATVDGKSAVGYTNKKGVRKNKLVATNKRGELPPNIVKPFWGYIKNKPGILADDQITWDEVAGKPPGFADGVDNGGGFITETFPCNNPINAAGEYVIFYNLPRGVVYDFQVVPTGNSAEYLYIDRVEVKNNADNTLDIWVRIDDFLDGGAGTCNLRRLSYPEGISVASAKQRLRGATVGYANKH